MTEVRKKTFKQKMVFPLIMTLALLTLGVLFTAGFWILNDGISHYECSEELIEVDGACWDNSARTFHEKNMPIYIGFDMIIAMIIVSIGAGALFFVLE